MGSPTSLLWYTRPLEYSQASEKRMEALELDTPTETVSILEGLPLLAGMLADLQVQQ